MISFSLMHALFTFIVYTQLVTSVDVDSDSEERQIEIVVFIVQEVINRLK